MSPADPDWLALSFGARGLFCLIERAADRHGALQLGSLGPKSVAAAVHAAWAEVEPLLAELLAARRLTIRGGVLSVHGSTEAREPASEAPTPEEERSWVAVIEGIGRTEYGKANGSPGPGYVANGYDLAWHLWQEVWTAKYLTAYTLSPDTGTQSEARVLQRIGRLAVERGASHAEPWLRHKMAAYLRDPGVRNYLADACHPLRCIERDWNKYGEPSAGQKKPRPAPPRAQAPEAPALSAAEIDAKMGGFLQKIGKGRAP